MIFLIYVYISNNSKFNKLGNDPTLYREGQLQRYLLKLKKKGVFNLEEYKMVYPTGSSLPRIYGLPTTHKLKSISAHLKLMPIISSIGMYNYGIAKYLTKKLSAYIPNEYTVQDSFTFVNLISQLDAHEKIMVSYDVESLFTNIPLKGDHKYFC